MDSNASSGAAGLSTDASSKTEATLRTTTAAATPAELDSVGLTSSSYHNRSLSLFDLPTDVLSHHLRHAFSSPSAVKVFRLVCRHFAKHVPLPKVFFPWTESSKEPFFPALQASDHLNVLLGSAAASASLQVVMDHLKSNTRLRVLTMSCMSHDLNLKLFRALDPVIDLLATTIHLEELGFTGVVRSTEQLDRLGAALHRLPHLKTLKIYILGANLDFSNLISGLSRKPKFEKLTLGVELLEETANALASWLEQPDCSLRYLTLKSLPATDYSRSFLTSFAKNRSLRAFRIRTRLEGNSTRMLFSSVTKQGHLEKLRCDFRRSNALKEFIHMLTSCKRLRGVDELGNFHPPEEECPADDLYNYIRSSHCIDDADALIHLSRNFQFDPAALMEAFASNTTISTISMELNDDLELLEICCKIISASKTLRTITFVAAQHLAEDLPMRRMLVAALKGNTSLERVHLHSSKLTPTDLHKWLGELFAAIGRLPRLSHLSVNDAACEHTALDLASTIRGSPLLRQINFANCSFSCSSLVLILDAISSSGKLEHLQMNRVTIFSEGMNQEELDRAWRNVAKRCPLETLQLNASRWQESTLNAILDEIESQPILRLESLMVMGTALTPSVHDRIQRIKMEKCGLLSVVMS